MYIINIPVESIKTFSSTVFQHKRPRHLEYKFLELDLTSISPLSHASISKFDSNHPRRHRRRRWGWGEGGERGGEGRWPVAGREADGVSSVLSREGGGRPVTVCLFA
jgi:hypothetical protein